MEATLLAYVKQRAAALTADRQGVTAIEYALIATFLAIAIIAAITALGTQISAQFGTIAAAL